MCKLWYRAPTRYHVPSRGETGFAKIALMLAMSAVTTAVAFCAATMRIGVTLSMPSATALAIFVKPICLIFWALQRAEVPALMCGTAPERSRIHRLLQRGQKRPRIALLHRFIAAIHMGRPENTERSVHCVQRRSSVLGLHCFLIITPIYFIINCASLTTHFTYRTKYIQFFIYSIQEFLAILVNS